MQNKSMISIFISMLVIVILSIGIYLFINNKQKNEHERETKKQLDHYVKLFSDPVSKEFITAIIYEDEEKIRKLVEAGMNLQVVGEYETTPLRVAITSDKPKMLSLLLELGADVNFSTPKGVTAAEFAVDNNNPEYLKILLSHGLDPNIKSGGDYIIFKAAHYPVNYDMLVVNGADLTVKQNVSKSNLGYLFAVIADYKHLRELIDKGVNVNEPTANDDTVVNVLVDHQKRFGADPNHPAVKARAEILELLRSKGSSVPEGV